MNDIHIKDLANPEHSEFQEMALAYGETLETHFVPGEILEEACAATGLANFGPMDFMERLSVICAEWEADEGLTGLGRATLRGRLVNHAKNRLLIQDILERHPEIHDIKIDRPIIVVGLPRTGTTHLLNLLAADSRLRSMPFWESEQPVPQPGEALLDNGRDPRYQRCEDNWLSMQQAVPHLAAMHPMDPDHINEEIELMLPNFASYNYEWFTYSPKWRDYYLAMDQLPHYQYMETVLKIMQFLQPAEWPTRWVLKSPMHLENLPELLRVFPDATFVVTHRDPVAVIQSTLTMTAYGQRMNQKKPLIRELAQYWPERIKHMLRRCAETFHLLPKAQTIHVPFHEFMADDLGMIEKVYARAGLDLTDRAQQEMRDFIDSHPRDKGGRVVYDLKGDFGLDPDGLRKQFQFYFDAFPARPEQI
jgi:hypothetical protein